MLQPQRWDFYAVSWADLQFPMTWVVCQDSQGRLSERWRPYGMPQLSPELEKLVIFMYGRHPSTGKWCLGGSGFLFGFPTERLGPNHIYAVTNWHVAVSGGFSSIRLHGRIGHDVIDLDPSDWVWKPRGYDLAISDITDFCDINRDDIAVVDAAMAVNPAYAESGGIGYGDDVFMLGMFANSPGDQRNAPTARFGNIAREPRDDAPIEQPTKAKARLPCYLIDMRSRTGHSGSPAFVFRTMTSDLRPMIVGGPDVISSQKTMFNLLGVHCAQYPETFEAAKSEARKKAVLREGDSLRGPSAMNVVVPAWAILELLEDRRLSEARKARDKKRAATGRERPVPESVRPLPAKADNPQHREDFSRLLNAAARKPK